MNVDYFIKHIIHYNMKLRLWIVFRKNIKSDVKTREKSIDYSNITLLI